MTIGKRFIVYIPEQFHPRPERLWTVMSAVERAANILGVKVEGPVKRNTLSMTVRYEGEEGETHVYSDFRKRLSEHEICEQIMHTFSNPASPPKILLPQIVTR